MLLIKNITNIPITVEGKVINPGSSIKLDIEYQSYLRSLERSGSLSIIYLEADSESTNLPIVTAKRRRKLNNLESE